MKIQTKNRKWLFVVIGTILLILSFFVLRKPKEELENFTIKKGEIKKEIGLSGKIDSEEKVSLQFQQGGLMSWIGVKEGDFVRKNQTIASLDTRSANISLKKALNMYSIARLDFDQTNEDYKNYQENTDIDYREKIKRILQKNQFNLENSVLDVEALDLAIKLSTITTPISGVVTKVFNSVAGVNILPSQSQFEIVNPSTLYFSVSVDQIDLPDLNQGKEVKIVLDAYPDIELSGKVESISFTPVLGETGTIYEVKVKFINLDNNDMKYKIGMTGDAKLVLEKKENVFFVPLDFIKEDLKGKYLLVGDKKEKIYIETGLESDSLVEIKGNIKEGDLVFKTSK